MTALETETILTAQNDFVPGDPSDRIDLIDLPPGAFFFANATTPYDLDLRLFDENLNVINEEVIRANGIYPGLRGNVNSDGSVIIGIGISGDDFQGDHNLDFNYEVFIDLKNDALFNGVIFPDDGDDTPTPAFSTSNLFGNGVNQVNGSLDTETYITGNDFVPGDPSDAWTIHDQLAGQIYKISASSPHQLVLMKRDEYVNQLPGTKKPIPPNPFEGTVNTITEANLGDARNTASVEIGIASDNFQGDHNLRFDYSLTAELPDIDFLTFTDLQPGASFIAEISGATFDTLLGWFDDDPDDDGNPRLLASDDNSGSGQLSLIQGIVPDSGKVNLAVSGTGDTEFIDYKDELKQFIGYHNESGDYSLTFLVTNSPPVITSDGGGDTAAVNAAENQTAVTDVQTSDDSNSEGAGLTYSLTTVSGGGVDNGFFTLDAATGVLTFTAAPDFETPLDDGTNNVYEVQVTVTDTGGLTDVQDIAVTITGTNDAPVIDTATSTLTGDVTEIADGAAGENTDAHSASGSIAFSDVDVTDTHTASFEAQGGDYRGTFSLVGNPTTTDATTTGTQDWSFSVNDADLDDLPAGQTLTQKYDVTIADGNGGTDTETVTITITGTNDAPVAKPDSVNAPQDGAVMDIDVLANDSDVDNDDDSSTLRVVEASADSGVTITLTGAPGDGISYDPLAAYASLDPALGPQVDVISYEIEDSHNARSEEPSEAKITLGLELEGTPGSDTLGGSVFGDSFEGGAGWDELRGGAGNDAYGLSLGDGFHNYIYEHLTEGGTDAVVLDAGITPSDVRLMVTEGRHLGIYAGEAGDRIVSVFHVNTLPGDEWQGPGVEALNFADGTVWDLTGGLTLTGTEVNNDTLDGTAYADVLVGLSGHDQLNGADGDDTLVGGSNNDTLNGGEGNDYLVGGSGYDELRGGAGDDAYELSLGDGDNYFFESGNVVEGGTDRVVLGAGITPNDVRLMVTEELNLAIYAGEAGDRILSIVNTLPKDEWQGPGAEELHFADGTVWDLTGGLTLTGTEVNDVLHGTQFSDVINGLDGNDQLNGADGDDTLKGGANNDTLNGGEGNDYLVGGSGYDELRGGAGDDAYELSLGDGDNYFFESGNVVEGGTDRVVLGAGITPNDVRLMVTEELNLAIYAGEAGDRILSIVNTLPKDEWQGPGAEELHFADGTVWDLTGGLTLTGTEVNDVLHGTQFSDVINGLDGNDQLNGADGDDTLKGGANNDTLNGGEGNDYLVGGSGYDELRGGAGDDAYELSLGDGDNYFFESGNVVEGGTDRVVLGAGITPNDVRLMVTEELNLAIYAGEAGDRILSIVNTLPKDEWQGPGAEELHFADGTVWDLTGGLTLTGTEVNDVLHGTQFSDVINGLDGNDQLNGADGDDTLKGGANNDTLNGGEGNDYLVGGSGYDELRGGAGDDAYELSLGDGDNYFFESGNVVEGGTDRVVLGAGITPNDVRLMVTEELNLAIYAGEAGDRILSIVNTLPKDEWQGPGAEELHFADGTVWDLTGGLTLTGTEVNDVLHGTQFSDVINGLDGNDQLNGADGDDTLKGNEGDDTLKGNDGDDTLHGGDGNDWLYGGGDGNNVLDGGAGNDELFGHGGDDVYLFGLGGGDDRILDQGGFDAIQLDATVTPDDVTLSVHGNLLAIEVGNQGDQIDVRDHFDLAGHKIEELHFADGTVWDLTKPVITSPDEFDINENNTAVGTITARDANGDFPTFSVTGGADAELFDLNDTTGVLSFKSSPDFENPQATNADNAYEIEITADDDNNTVSPLPAQAVQVTITDVNEPPTAVSLENVVSAIAEDADTSTRIKIADIVVTDDALGSNSLTLSGADAAKFEIDGTALYLKAGTVLDYESDAGFDVTVNADDTTVGATPDATVNHSVTITDVNEPVGPITDANAAADEVDENAANGTVVGITASATDEDAADSVTYSLDDDADGRFAIDANTGVITVADGGKLDHEAPAGNSHDVIVRATSSRSGSTETSSSTKTFTVAVTDVNEPPTAVSLENVVSAIAEDADTSLPIKIADIVVTDDALGSNSLTLSGADAAKFEIDGTGLYLKAGTVLDHESDAGFDVTVNADDTTVGATPDATVNHSVTITDVNEPPTAVSLENVVSAIAEDADTSTPIKIADIVVTDDALGSNSLTLSGADAAKFEIDGTGLYLKAGTVLDHESDAGFDVTVNADDTTVGATPDATVNHSVTITDVNEPPTAVSLENVVSAIAEDADTSTRIKIADIVVTDDALGSNSLTLSGADAAKFEIDGTGLYLKAGTVLDHESDAGFDVTVNADDTTVGATPDATVNHSVTITDVNEPPTAVSLENVVSAIAEDADTSTRIKIADIVVTDDALGSNSLTLSGADAAKFEIDGTGLYLKAGTVLDHESDAGFDVTVNADDTTVGATPDATVNHSVTITDVNEPPTAVSLENVVSAIAEDADTSTRIKIADIVVTDDALGSNSLTLSGADAAKFEIDGTALYLKAGTVLDYESDAGFDVTVNADDTTVGATPDATVNHSVTITDVNEPPTAVSLENVVSAIAEDADTSTPIKIADIVVTDDALGSNSLTLSGADAAKFEIDGTGLYLKAGTVLDHESDAGFDVTVNADDTTVGATPDATVNHSVTITDVNEPPTAVSLENVVSAIAEDADTSTPIKIADIVVTDDALGSNSLTLSGADAAKFEIDGTALYLKAGTVLDYESDAGFDVTVNADDTTVGATPDATVNHSVTITDVNEPPTAVSLENVVSAIAEDADTSTPIKIADIVVTDDALGSNSLTLSGADAAKFEIDGTGLYLKAGTVLDHESDAGFDVTVNADDTTVGATPDATVNHSVTITDVNEPPTAVSLENVVSAIAEDADTSTRIKIADIVVTDDALGSNSLTLSGADAAKFEIDGTGLYLKAGTVLDHESDAGFDVTVNADDTTVGATPDATVNHSVTITDVNEPPTAVSLENVVSAIAEDADTSTPIKIADIVVTDDALGSNSLTLSGADAAKFEIDGTGLYLKAGTVLDHESDAGFDVTVNADDTTVGATPDATVNHSVTITDVNEPPTAVSLENVVSAIAEDADTSTRIKIADIVVTDDALGSNSLTLSGADAAKFEIDGTALYLKAGTVLDHESDAGFDVTVNADDTTVGATPDATVNHSVTITDVNEPPTAVSLENVVSAIAEDADTSTRIKIADIVVTDDALGSNSLTLSGADAAKFEIDGTGLYLKAGTVLDHESDAGFDVTVNADDTTVGATPDATVNHSVTITDVNEPPTAVSLENVVSAIAEDADTSTRIKIADIVVTDDALGSNSLTLSGADAAKFEIDGTALYLKTGTVLDHESDAGFDVTVNADDTTVGATPDATVNHSVTITDVNEPVGPITDANAAADEVDENAANGTVVGITASATDEDAADSVTYSLDDDADGRFAIDANTGVITVADGGKLDHEAPAGNSHDVIVRATSSRSGSTETSSSTKTFTVAVTDVNEPPTAVSLENVVSAIAEDADTSTRIKIADIVVTDDALGSNSLTLSGADAAKFEIDGTALYLKAGTVLDHESDAGFDVTVNADDTTVGATPDATVNHSVTITDVNEPVGPITDANAAADEVDENAANGTVVGITASATDEDAADSVTYSLDDDADGRFAIDANTGVITVADGGKLDHEAPAGNSHDVIVRATSSRSGSTETSSSTKTFTVAVTDVNEPPTAVSLENVVSAIAEDADTSLPIKIADIVVTDDALGSNSLSLSGADAAKFEIDGTALYLKTGTVLDHESDAGFDVTVNADDTTVGATPDATVNHSVTITDVNEPVGPITDANAAADEVDENAANGTVVGITASATDEDAADSVTYSLDDDADGRFAIDANTGVITVADGGKLDHEAPAGNSHDVIVRATSSRSGSTETSSSTKTFTVAVNDVNEPPTAVSLENVVSAIAEDADTSLPIKIADIVVTDDALGTNSLSLSGADAAKFEIDGTGLYLKAGTVLDYETDPGFDVTVNADDTTVGATPDDSVPLAIEVQPGDWDDKGLPGHDSITGGRGKSDDTFYGGAGQDTITGGNGNDSIYGGSGNDSISGGNHDDTIYGGSGNDTLDGDNRKDKLWGGSGDDSLTGGNHDDSLCGGAGNDTLEGGAGDDILKGGADSDVFVFEASAGTDTIQDFTALSNASSPDQADLIDLSALGFGSYQELRTQFWEDYVDGKAGIWIPLDVDMTGDEVFLVGVKPEELNADDFLIA